MATASAAGTAAALPPPTRTKSPGPARSVLFATPPKPAIARPKTPSIQEYERVFEHMREEIAAQRRKVEALEKLRDDMTKATQAFDPEDHEVVDRIHAALAQDLATRDADYQKRLNTYKTVLLTMRQSLDTRQRTLESLDQATRVLQDNPELMQFFAQKQASLRKLYDETCAQLAS